MSKKRIRRGSGRAKRRSINEKYDEVRELIRIGKEKGYLLYDEVNELLPSDIESNDALEELFDTFGEAGIEVAERRLVTFERPTARLQEAARVELVGVNDEFLALLHSRPEALQELTPSKFEEVVESIYRNQGFDIERLGSVFESDGGVDLIAVSKTVALGEIRIAVQCKTVHPVSRRQKISSTPLRELHGVLDRFRAHKGILTTTGTFTDLAIEEQARHFFRVSLEDRDAILERIESALRGAVTVYPDDKARGGGRNY